MTRDDKRGYLILLLGVLITIGGLFLASYARADVVSFAYGANPPFGGMPLHVKEVQADYQTVLVGSLWHKVGGAYWFESAEGSNSALFAYSLGTRVDSQPLCASLYWGVGYLTSPDYVWLSGHAQFVNDVSIGVCTKTLEIGPRYRHVSDGPIESLQPGPNRGRDFVLIGLEFKI